MKVIILGAGPTGLGAAWRLQELNHPDWQIWEQESLPGGLSRSLVDADGFTWDIGGHVQFSHYRKFDALMNISLGGDGWLDHERESWVRIFNTWVPYPFQYNIHRLPKDQILHCIKGLLAIRDHACKTHFANFRQMIMNTFGEGLAELFMLPYNQKVWAYPPESMGTGWLGERVAIPDLGRIMDSVINDKDNISWGPNNTFRFPRHGGTGAVWKGLAGKLPQEKIFYNREVTEINPHEKWVRAADGSQEGYDVLISTLPLDRLVRMAGIEEHKERAARLKYSSTWVTGVALKGKPGPDIETKCWMYFPEQNCPFYRATVFSNYSPNNVPDINRYWSLMSEISESPAKPVDAAAVEKDTIQGMLNTGLIRDAADVDHTWTIRVEYGYPTPSIDRDKAINIIVPDLEQRQIYSRGRFGAWKYEVGNQDHSLMQGVELADRLVHGSPELTVWFPNMVNGLHPAYGKEWI